MATVTQRINKGEFDTVCNLYDTFDPIIKRKCKDNNTASKLVKIFQAFFDKNRDKLATDIIGYQVLVNEKMEQDIFNTFGIDKDDVKEAIRDSEYFKAFGKDLALLDQLCLAVPLILASLEYYRIGTQKAKENSDLCYLLSFFKPYASRESVFFKYEVNEAQMRYTIENLEDRFDIKKYGTIISVLQNKAKVSFSNYIEPLKATDKLSDRDLHVIYSSGIASRVNQFIGAIVERYRANEGKELHYDASAVAYFDKDTQSIDYMENSSVSDIAAKNDAVNKVITKITKDPIDKALLVIAIKQSGFSVNKDNINNYTDMLKNTVTEIIDKMFSQLPEFFNSLLTSFLFTINPNTEKIYTVKDMKTPTFLRIGVETLIGKKSHLSKDSAMWRARDLFSDMLDKHSDVYASFGNTYRNYFRKALAIYWIYLIRGSI